MSSISLIFTSAVSNLLLILSSEVFISDILFLISGSSIFNLSLLFSLCYVFLYVLHILTISVLTILSTNFIIWGSIFLDNFSCCHGSHFLLLWISSNFFFHQMLDFLIMRCWVSGLCCLPLKIGGLCLKDSRPVWSLESKKTSFVLSFARMVLGQTSFKRQFSSTTKASSLWDLHHMSHMITEEFSLCLASWNISLSCVNSGNSSAYDTPGFLCLVVSCYTCVA